jgi:hypothetical protein
MPYQDELYEDLINISPEMADRMCAYLYQEYHYTPLEFAATFDTGNSFLRKVVHITDEGLLFRTIDDYAFDDPYTNTRRRKVMNIAMFGAGKDQIHGYRFRFDKDGNSILQIEDGQPAPNFTIDANGDLIYSDDVSGTPAVADISLREPGYVWEDS